MEGSFEQLLVKAHFEKAKLQDLSGCPNEPKQFKGYIKSNAKVPSSGHKRADDKFVHGNNNTQRCCQCNSAGHHVS